MDARQRLNQKRKQTQGKATARGRGAVGKASRAQAQAKGGVRGRLGATTPGVRKGAGTIGKARPVKDLRQLIGGKTTTKKGKAPTLQTTGVKKRLGLISASKRKARQTEGRLNAQASRNSDGYEALAAAIRISNPSSRNRPLIARPAGGADAAKGSKNRVWRRSDLDPQIIFPQQQAAPTIILAGGQPFNMGDFTSSGSGQVKGNSVVVSNLNMSITQADILELFGDIGSISSYHMINPTTAMISYLNQPDATKAVQTYHNRLLDGLPMQCTLIPSPGIAAQPSSGGGNRHISQAFQQALRNSR